MGQSTKQTWRCKMKVSRKWSVSLSVTLGALILLWAVGAAMAQWPGPVGGVQRHGGVSTVDVVPAQANRLYHLSFYKGDTTSTLYLQNPNSMPAGVELIFYDSGGGAAANVVDTIPARGTLVVPADSVAGLPDGHYSLIVDSDHPVESVVHVRRPGAGVTSDKLGVYRGTGSAEAATPQYFGPFYKMNGGLNSSLLVLNVGSTSAQVDVLFLKRDDGSTATTTSATVVPGGQFAFVGPNLLDLPDGFVGWAKVTASQPVVGLLTQYSAKVYRLQGPLKIQGTYAYLPRALKKVDEGSGPRTTTLFVANIGSSEANAMLYYYTADGMSGYSPSFNLPASGAATIDLRAEDNLPSGSIRANALAGDQPLVIGEQTYHDTTSPYSTGVYGSDADMELGLPRLVRSGVAYTVFSLQNVGLLGDASVSVDYYGRTGALVFSQMATVPPQGWVRYNQSEMTELGDIFEGSAIVSSGQSLMAWVDEYTVASGSPTTTTIDPEEGGTLVYTDTQDSLTTLDVPSDAVTDTTTIALTPVDAVSLPQGLSFGGHAFDLDAFQNGDLIPGFTFEKAVMLTVEYSDADMAWLDEETLALHRWTGSGWEEIGERPPETYTLDIENNRLTAYLLGFSRFSTMGVGVEYHVFLPLVLRNR
jgi:hypothetical protein